MSVIVRNLSKALSMVFQPLLIPLYNLLLLSLYTQLFTVYKYGIRSFLLPVVILTFIIPCMFILILRTTGYIGDFSLSKSKDRILPYFIYIVSNISLVYIFSKVNVPLWFLGFIGLPAFMSLIALIINFFFRISAYMLALSACISTVIFISFVLEGINPDILLMILFIVSGLVAASRLYLEKETPTELYVGFAVGLPFTYLYYYLFIYYFGFYFV